MCIQTLNKYSQDSFGDIAFVPSPNRVIGVGHKFIAFDYNCLSHPELADDEHGEESL